MFGMQDSSEFKVQLSETLKAIRGDESQEDFGGRVGMSRDAYSKCESRGSFPIEKLAALSSISGKSVDEILTGVPGALATTNFDFMFLRSTIADTLEVAGSDASNEDIADVIVMECKAQTGVAEESAVLRLHGRLVDRRGDKG